MTPHIGKPLGIPLISIDIRCPPYNLESKDGLTVSKPRLLTARISPRHSEFLQPVTSFPDFSNSNNRSFEIFRL